MSLKPEDLVCFLFSSDEKVFPSSNAFGEWSDHIRERLSFRDSSRNKRYEQGLDKELYSFSVDRSKLVSSPKYTNKSLVLVHPFYINFIHTYKLSNPRLNEEARAYSKDLFETMSWAKNNGFHVSVFDTLHLYAIYTSFLNEEGLVDSVFFTEYDSGCLMNKQDLLVFKDDLIFFGGGYNARCLSRLIDEFKAVVPVDSLKVITDLVLESPRQYSSLKSSYVRELDLKNHVCLEDFFRKIA